MASFRYVFADVFTDVPFAGNQLAVFTDARGIPEEQLQPLAREINFAETVFVYPAAGEGHALIRIFTPAQELPFAGHPVLGTAFVLGGPLQLDELWLETGRGIVPVRLERDGSRIVFGWMSQPAASIAPFGKTDELLAALGVPEDPATGSAAGPLAVHLARHGRIEFGQEIEISQGAEIGRPSRLYARATRTADRVDSVEVAGAAVIVARGEFRL